LVDHPAGALEMYGPGREIVRALSDGIALADPPPRPAPAGFATEALRQASLLGAQLKDLALPKDKAGRTVVSARSVLRVIRRVILLVPAGWRAEADL
jgi:hypothetical protein